MNTEIPLETINKIIKENYSKVVETGSKEPTVITQIKINDKIYYVVTTVDKWLMAYLQLKQYNITTSTFHPVRGRNMLVGVYITLEEEINNIVHTWKTKSGDSLMYHTFKKHFSKVSNIMKSILSNNE